MPLAAVAAAIYIVSEWAACYIYSARVRTCCCMRRTHAASANPLKYFELWPLIGYENR
jgi:hypothetical protein